MSTYFYLDLLKPNIIVVNQTDEGFISKLNILNSVKDILYKTNKFSDVINIR